tara:strand:- start:574 stop:1122 length:549 start_codon:yes stop_codon:yes gene_type:complete
MQDPNQNVKTGRFYTVAGTVKGDEVSFLILVDQEKERYIPVGAIEDYCNIADSILQGQTPPPTELGLLFSFWSLMKATGHQNGRIVLDHRKDENGPYFSTWTDCFHVTETFVNMAKVPISMADGVLLGMISHMPIIVYDHPESPASNDIPDGTPKDFAAIMGHIQAEFLTEDEPSEESLFSE